MKTITLKNAEQNIREADRIGVMSDSGGAFFISKKAALQWLAYKIEMRKQFPLSNRIFIQPFGKRRDVYVGEKIDDRATREVI